MINNDEAFELDVVGAMACSTPVIAMNRDMVSELIRDWETGFLVNNIDEAAEPEQKVGYISRKKCRERWKKFILLTGLKMTTSKCMEQLLKNENLSQ